MSFLILNMYKRKKPLLYIFIIIVTYPLIIEAALQKAPTNHPQI
jgi:hypothetical protein